MVDLVFAGRSNVGKSSIIRKLTGKKVGVGKRPGVTRDFNRIKLGKNLYLLDLPGFGHIAGMDKKKEEEIKNKIVEYLEGNSEEIISSIQVIDSSSFLDIAERWKKRDQIPVAVELFSFLRELNLKPIVAANKIDKIKSGDMDEVLDGICVELGLDPPWEQWPDIIVPVSAKTGRGIDTLHKLIRKRFQGAGREDLLRYI